MGNPGRSHWEALKWLVKCLKCSSNLGLMFRMSKEWVILKGYTDTDFVRDRYNRISTSSSFYTPRRTAISWKSQLQKIVALSGKHCSH